jgi:hypothetical protein
MDGLVFLSSWSKFEAPSLSFVYISLTISLNSLCGNSVSQKVRMIVLLRMVNYKRLKNSFFVHFDSCLIMKQGSSCIQICPLTPCLLWPRTMASLIFHAHHRN